MTIQVVDIDPSSLPEDRSATWTDSDFVQGDFLDVLQSLGKAATYAEIITAADASISLRFNSLNRRSPIHPDAKNLGFSAPDLSVVNTWTNTNAYSLTVSNGETVEQNFIIKNIEIVSVTAGSGITIRTR